MKQFINSWRNFLTEGTQLTEKTAAKKRGVHVPPAREAIEKYVSPSNEPKYFVTFSTINKLGINPRSGFKTPLGIYSYVVSPDFIEQYRKGRIEFAANREFALVFKVREGTGGILYNTGEGSLGEAEFHDYLNELFSPGHVNQFKTPFLDAVYKQMYEPALTLRAISEDEAKVFVDHIMNESLKLHEFGYKWKNNRPNLEGRAKCKKINDAGGKNCFTEIQNAYLRGWAQYLMQAPYGDFNKKLSKYEVWDKVAKSRDEVFMQPMGSVKDGVFTRREERELNVHARMVEKAVEDIVGKALRKDGVKREVYQAEPSFYKMQLQKDVAQGSNSKMREKFYELAIEESKGGDILPWETSLIKGAMEEALVDTNMGRLWNITRLAAKKDIDLSEYDVDLYESKTPLAEADSMDPAAPITKEDMHRWSYILRAIGIDAVVDVGNQGMIHQNEPEQAVFLSREYVDLVEVLYNTDTPDKHYERGEAETAASELEQIGELFRNALGRDPDGRETHFIRNLLKMRGISFFKSTYSARDGHRSLNLRQQRQRLIGFLMLSHISYVYRDILLAYGLKRWAPNPKTLGKPPHPREKSGNNPLRLDFVKSAYDGLQVTLREKLKPLKDEMVRTMNANSTFNATSTTEIKEAYPEMLEIIKQYRDYFMKDASFINRGLNEVDKVDWEAHLFPPETQKLLKDMNAVLDAQRQHIKEI